MKWIILRSCLWLLKLLQQSSSKLSLLLTFSLINPALILTSVLFSGFQQVTLNIIHRLTHLSILSHQVNARIYLTIIPVSVNSDLMGEIAKMISIIASHRPVYTVKCYVTLFIIESYYFRFNDQARLWDRKVHLKWQTRIFHRCYRIKEIQN